jgi:hypothetical protein
MKGKVSSGSIFGAGLLAAVCLLFAGCGSDCTNASIMEKLSPDGKRKAIVYHRECGAFDDRPYATMVALVDPDQDAPDADGNVFIADWNKAQVPQRSGGPAHAIDVQVSWESEAVLLVSFPQRARVMKQENSVGEVAVRYEKK